MNNSNGKPADAFSRIAGEDGRERLQDVGRELRSRANDARQDIAQQLKNAAGSIRKELNEADIDEDAMAQAARVVQQLDNAASYLESHTIEDIEANATETVRENVWQSLLITLVIGVIIGFLLGRD